MTMRKCKLAILAIAVLLQVHSGAGDLFGETPQAPKASQAEAITRQETRIFRKGAFGSYFKSRVHA